MPFPLRRVLDPIVEPLSLADMKLHLRVDSDYEDDLISTLISTTRERAEDLTGRSLLSQQWIFGLDKFPSYYGAETGGTYIGEHHHHRHDEMYRSDKLAIILPRGPVISVDSITWTDFSGNINTLSPTQYNVDLLSEPARIRPLYNSNWPWAIFDTNSVIVTFTCGYQQTVTEQLTATVGESPVVVVSRIANLLSVGSIYDVASITTEVPLGNPITPTAVNLATGHITLPAGESGLAVNVTYLTSSIPKAFIHAMKLMGTAWYENRSEVVQGGGNFNSMPTPMGASSLLSTYELFKFGYPKG